MGIIFDNTKVTRVDGIDTIFPRDANDKPAAVLAGLTEDGVYKIAQFTDEGKLKIDASITIEDIDIGDVNIRVKDATGSDIQVSGGTNPDTITKFLYAQDQRMGFVDGGLQVFVNESALPAGAATEQTLGSILEALGGEPNTQRLSEFGEATFIAEVDTDIINYVVPAGQRIRIMGARGWADVDAEYYIKIGSTQVDGYRTTPAQLTMDIDTSEVQYANAGETIHLGAKHFSSGPARTFKGVIQGITETV